MIFGKDMSTLRKLMLLKAATGVPLNEYEASGNPLTFETNKAKPLKKLLLSWTPTQSGTGNPSPENVRPISGMSGVNVTHCGANLMDYTRIADTNVGTDLTGERKAVSFTKPGKYYVKALRTWNEAYLYARVKNADGTFGNILYVVANKTVQNKTVTLTEGQTLIMFNASTGINGTVEKTIERFEGWGIVVSYSDMTTYEPYSGTSYSVAFPATGKNLFDVESVFKNPSNTAFAKTTKRIFTPNTYCLGISYDNYFNSSNVTSYSRNGDSFTCNVKNGYSVGYALKLKPETQYKLSATEKGAIKVAFYAEDGTYISGSTSIPDDTFTVPSSADITILLFGLNNQDTTYTKVMVNEGSSALPYEPYTRTVYGGTLDLTTGVLTAEWASFSGQWQDGTNETAVGETLKRRMFTLGYVPQTGTANNICNVAPYGSGSSETTKFNVSVTSGVGYAYVTLPNDTSETEDIHIVSKLAESAVVATLSPTQITALIGNNTMWASADNLSVTYLKKG